MRELLLPFTEGRRGREGIQGWFPHPREGEGSFPQGSMWLCWGPSQHCCGPGIVLESICRVCRDSELPCVYPLPILAHPNPSSSERPLGLCLTLEMQEETKPLLGQRSRAPGSAVLSTGGLMPRSVSLAASEPTVEEKLQKLHSEIKFALKVDNPVSARERWPGLGGPCLSCPRPPRQPCPAAIPGGAQPG